MFKFANWLSLPEATSIKTRFFNIDSDRLIYNTRGYIYKDLHIFLVILPQTQGIPGWSRDPPGGPRLQTLQREAVFHARGRVGPPGTSWGILGCCELGSVKVADFFGLPMSFKVTRIGRSLENPKWKYVKIMKIIENMFDSLPLALARLLEMAMEREMFDSYVQMSEGRVSLFINLSNCRWGVRHQCEFAVMFTKPLARGATWLLGRVFQSRNEGIEYTANLS